MFLMKRRTLALFAGGVGALGLLAMTEKYRQSRVEMKKAALIQDIRQELSHLGPIAVLYTNLRIKKILGSQEVSS